MNKKRSEDGKAEKLIEELIRDVSEAQNVPLSQGKVIINKDEFIEKLENIEQMLRTELGVYREISDKRARIITDAENEAENIIYEAE